MIGDERVVHTPIDLLDQFAARMFIWREAAYGNHESGTKGIHDDVSSAILELCDDFADLKAGIEEFWEKRFVPMRDATVGPLAAPAHVVPVTDAGEEATDA